MSSKEAIRNGACYSMGNGWSINLTTDLWIP